MVFLYPSDAKLRDPIPLRALFNVNRTALSAPLPRSVRDKTPLQPTALLGSIDIFQFQSCAFVTDPLAGQILINLVGTFAPPHRGTRIQNGLEAIQKAFHEASIVLPRAGCFLQLGFTLFKPTTNNFKLGLDSLRLVRRELHRLRQQGVEIIEIEPTKILDPGQIPGSGEHRVWIVRQ